MERADREIAASLRRTYDLTVDRVRCPDKVEVEVGATFACSARIGGQQLAVTVTQRTEAGDLRVTPDSAVLVMADVRADLKDTISRQLGKENLRAGCGSATLKIVPPGGSFECKVSDGAGERIVTVLVRDSLGNLTYTLD